MKKTIGVIFSGYGQQFVTMGKDLYDDSRQVQDLFEQASMCLNINFVQLCFAASDAEISELYKGYLAILLIQVSIYSQLAHAGLKPDFIAGYDTGEYAAVVASGSLNFADALYLLHKYGQIFNAFIHEHPYYGILKIPKGVSFEDLQGLCKKLSTEHQKVFIAAHNTQQGFYVAGHIDLIEEIKEYCKIHEIRKVRELRLGYGLHSSIVDIVTKTLTPYFFKIDFKPLKCPVITNVDGAYVTSPDALESALLRKINAPILWDEVMDGFIGCEILIFIGPGTQQMEWAQQKYPDKECYLIQSLDDLQKVIVVLQQHAQESIVQPVNESEDDIVFGNCHVDESFLQLSDDLTIADEINELPGDYDIDEHEDEE